MPPSSGADASSGGSNTWLFVIVGVLGAAVVALVVFLWVLRDSGDDSSLTTADLLAGSTAPTAEGGTAMIDFDPTVELLDANSIGFNDDGPTSADSQLVATATTGGFHTVAVSAFDSNKCGLFDVTVTVASSGAGGGGTDLDATSVRSPVVYPNITPGPSGPAPHTASSR